MKGSVVTPIEYKRIREYKLKMTQAELAAKLGVKVNTVYRREAGILRILKEAELALRYLAGTSYSGPPVKKGRK